MNFLYSVIQPPLWFESLWLSIAPYNRQSDAGAYLLWWLLLISGSWIVWEVIL